VHKLVKRIEISLPISSSFPVFRHDCLRFNRYPNGRWLRLDDPRTARWGTHTSGRRAQNQVNIPLATPYDYLSVDGVDELSLPGVLGYPRTGIEKILQDDSTEKLAVLV
jgi:hypothetical protein